MSGLKGKFIRRDGTYAIFGSRNKPEWKGIEISGRCDPNLESGEYYELEMEGRTLVGWRKLAPMTGGGSYSAPQQSHTAPSQSAAPGEVPMGSLMASATGFAKSAMESRSLQDLGGSHAGGNCLGNALGHGSGTEGGPVIDTDTGTPATTDRD